MAIPEKETIPAFQHLFYINTVFLLKIVCNSYDKNVKAT